MAPASPYTPTSLYDKRPQYLSKGALLQLARDFNIHHEEEILRTDLAHLVNLYIHAHEPELIGNEKYRRLFGGRRGRALEASPSSSPDEDGKTSLNAISARAQNVVNETIKPTLYDAFQSASEYIIGDDAAAQASSSLQASQRKMSKASREISARAHHAVNGMGGIGPASESQLMTGSPARNLRNAGNAVASSAEQAIDTVAPVANRVGEIVKDGADRGLVAWEQFGRREFIEGVRHVQEQLSNSKRLIVLLLMFEMLVLLWHILPWQKYTLEIPPSKYSFARWKRALHYALFFMPERHFSFSLPQTLAPFSPAGRTALGSWLLWCVSTVAPPFLASSIVTFLPQDAGRRVNRQSTRDSQPSLPQWDPMVFTIVRLGLAVWPLTSACPDEWRNMLEATGSLSGRVLIAAVAFAFVLAERMAELVRA
ncbi:hypothetical protein NliqN6_1013 [Naganishia liquefaciens]|uniref:Uncharacterized protein n=1 Tax=Naganishia liquefaciens TaxID=104408 RepID=A0A8H3YEC1_9TREE|nr:hypothetical protein NliqN6_1013 [Naganishia liquefaciens]